MAETNLLPCPFCGDPMRNHHGIIRHTDQGNCIIGIQAWDETKLSAWNTRPQASRIEELEAVRAAAQVVFDGLLARIDNAAPTAVPVFTGIAELSDALSALNGEQG